MKEICMHEKMSNHLIRLEKRGVHIMGTKILNQIYALCFQEKTSHKEHYIQNEYVFGDLRDIIEHFKNLR